MSWYVKGGAIFDDLACKAYMYLDISGYPSGQYISRNDSHLEVQDPYWRMGGSAGGAKESQFGLYDHHRIKCDLNSVWGWDNSSGVWIDLLSPGGVSDHGLLSGLTDDDHTQYHNVTRANTWLGTKSTTNLSEGTNLYYTHVRAVAAVEAAGLIMDNPIDMKTNLLTVGDSADTSDPITLLEFETERIWFFRKRSTGASTSLNLECDTAGKSFKIGYTNLPIISFYTNNVDTSQYINAHSHKITYLANGTLATDAMAFGQKYTNANVEAVITAELVNGQSIDNAIDNLINTHNVANRHLDHSTISITAGTGLTGGGTIAANRTINCDITQYTDALAVAAIEAKTPTLTLSGSLKIDGSTKAAQCFYDGAVTPTNTNRLNYDGHLHATKVYGAVYN